MPPYKFASKVKYLSRKVKYNWKQKGEGIECSKITYYPRKPDHQDPPINPSKLLMVERVKPYKGNPYWDKRILDDLKLGEDSTEKIAIVKNTPDNCAMLMKIKHVLKITPIELPEKLPDDLLTNKETYLHENGKLMIFPRADEKRLEAFEKFTTNMKKFDPETMKKHLRLKWVNPMESYGSVCYNVNNND